MTHDKFKALMNALADSVFDAPDNEFCGTPEAAERTRQVLLDALRKHRERERRAAEDAAFKAKGLARCPWCGGLGYAPAPSGYPGVCRECKGAKGVPVAREAEVRRRKEALDARRRLESIGGY